MDTPSSQIKGALMEGDKSVPIQFTRVAKRLEVALCGCLPLFRGWGLFLAHVFYPMIPGAEEMWDSLWKSLMRHLLRSARTYGGKSKFFTPLWAVPPMGPSLLSSLLSEPDDFFILVLLPPLSPESRARVALFSDNEQFTEYLNANAKAFFPSRHSFAKLPHPKKDDRLEDVESGEAKIVASVAARLGPEALPELPHPTDDNLIGMKYGEPQIANSPAAAWLGPWPPPGLPHPKDVESEEAKIVPCLEPGPPPGLPHPKDVESGEAKIVDSPAAAWLSKPKEYTNQDLCEILKYLAKDQTNETEDTKISCKSTLDG